MPLSTKEYKEVLRLIEEIYSTTDSQELFHHFWAKLQKFVPFNTSVFVPSENHDQFSFQEHGFLLHNISPKYIPAYLEYYYKDVLVPHLARAFTSCLPHANAYIFTRYWNPCGR